MATHVMDMTVTVTPETPVVDSGEGHCARCGGLMVTDRFIDLLDDTGNLEFTAARCVQCGEVVDPVILQNRSRRAAHQGPPARRSGSDPWQDERDETVEPSPTS
jgi:hypothetical protein